MNYPVRALFISNDLENLVREYRMTGRLPWELWHKRRSEGIRELVFFSEAEFLDENMLSICRARGYRITLVAPLRWRADSSLRDQVDQHLRQATSKYPVLVLAGREYAEARQMVERLQPEAARDRETTATRSPFVHSPAAKNGKQSNTAPGVTRQVEARVPAPSLPEAQAPPADSASVRDVLASDNARGWTPFFSIRFKLLSIISIIIIAALSGMIALATGYFKEDSKITIQEQNLYIARLSASRVELALHNLSYLARNIATEGFPPGQINEDNNQIALVAVVGRADGRAVVEKQHLNEATLARSALDRGLLERLILEREEEWARCFKGDQVLLNISPGLARPTLLLGVSLEPDRRIALAVVSGRSFQVAFDRAGALNSFLVDTKGRLIGHADETLVLNSLDLARSPLVGKMLESEVQNAQVRYLENESYHLGSFQKIPAFGLAVMTTIAEDDAFATVYSIQRRNIYLMIIFVTLAILVVLYFSRSMTVPLRKLVAYTGRVESGDFAVTLTPGSRDEIGLLTTAFSNMTRGLAEREKMKEALYKFASKDIAEKAMRGELKLGGENKTCAILFTDLRNFTTISEQMAPEDVLKFLNDYYTEMANWILLAHGTLDKFIGDAMMAWWGAIESRGPAEDTELAINAALMMRESLISLNTVRAAAGKAGLNFGVGINTGPVVAGQIGSEARIQYTVIGDSVNLASRVESLNVVHGSDVLVTEGTYNLVSEIFVGLSMPFVPIKGKTERVNTVAILGRRDDPGSPRSLDELRERLGIQAPANTI